MIGFFQAPANSASQSELIERIAELEEQNQDGLDEIDALNEELEFLHESWTRATKSNEELARRLQVSMQMSQPSHSTHDSVA